MSPNDGGPSLDVSGAEAVAWLASRLPCAAARRDIWGIALALFACFSFACRRQAPLTPYTAYVVNQQSSTLAAVNLADFRVTAALPVAARPERVLKRPGAPQLYVASASGKITVAGYSHFHVVTTLNLGRSANALAFSPDGLSAYILNPADHAVVFLDCGGVPGGPAEDAVPKISFRLRLSGALRDMALSPDGKTLVVDSETPNQITFVSTQARQVLGTLEVGKSPGPLVILPDNSKVFVADGGDEKVSAASMASQRLYSHIEIGVRPTALLLKPDGGEIFVLSATSSNMIILDAFHDNVERSFSLGSDPATGVFRNDGSWLFIANAGDGSVLAVNVQNREVRAWTHVGMEPRALALTPDQRLLVVADRAASSLAVLNADPDSLSSDRPVLITTVPVGGAPVDVVVPELEGAER